MFPKTLDDATVLFYTEKGNYGAVNSATGEVSDRVYFLAICRYENANEYYLFGCDENYAVVSDSLWGSVEECQRVAEASCTETPLWIPMA